MLVNRHRQSLLPEATILSRMTGSRTGFSRSLAAIAIAATTSLMLSSCGGGEEPSDPGTASSSTPASPESSSAAGGTAEIEGAQFTAPAGWEVRTEDSSYVLGAPYDDHPTGAGIFNTDSTLASDVDELAEAALSRVETAYPDGKRLPDVTYGGNTFFHLRGTNNTERFDQYGTLAGDSAVVVAWSFNPEWVTREEADEFIEQVMPSFKYEG